MDPSPPPLPPPDSVKTDPTSPAEDAAGASGSSLPPPKNLSEAKKAKGRTELNSLPLRSKLTKETSSSSSTTAAAAAAAAAAMGKQPAPATVAALGAMPDATNAAAMAMAATAASALPPPPPAPPAKPEKKKRGSERNYVNGVLMVKCQCRNPKDCRKIVSFWCHPPSDGTASKHRDGRRAGYIELPHNRRIEKTVLHEFENQRRERFFQYLTGGTSATETKTKKQTRDYVALHHFPVSVLQSDGSGLTQETVNATEALELGLTQQDRVTVQGYLSGVSFEGQYIVVPNYPWKHLVEEYLALGGDPRELQGNLDDPTAGLPAPGSMGIPLPIPSNAKLPLPRPLATAALRTDGVRGFDRVTLLEARLEQKDLRIQEQDSRIIQQDKRISEQDARIQEQDKRIQELESWTGISSMGSGMHPHPHAPQGPHHASPGATVAATTAAAMNAMAAPGASTNTTPSGVLPSKKRKSRS